LKSFAKQLPRFSQKTFTGRALINAKGENQRGKREKSINLNEVWHWGEREEEPQMARVIGQ
jgi:hypothetical protein